MKNITSWNNLALEKHVCTCNWFTSPRILIRNLYNFRCIISNFVCNSVFSKNCPWLGLDFNCLYFFVCWLAVHCIEKDNRAHILNFDERCSYLYSNMYQFGCGISKVVGPKKQDFWPRINLSTQRKKFKKSEDRPVHVKTGT